MNFKLLALTFLMFLVGCNQGSSGLRQKPASQKYKQVAVEPVQNQEVPPPMTRGSVEVPKQETLETQNTGSQAGATVPVAAANAGSQPTTISNTSTSVQTSKVETIPTGASGKSTTASQGEGKVSTIGNLNLQTGPVKPPSEVPEAQKPRGEKTAPAQTVTAPIDEKKAAATAGKRLDTKAQSAEKTEDDTRTPEEKELWQKLIDYIADHGEKSDSRMGFYISLKDETSEDRFTPRVANYISIVGGPGDNGSFSYSRAEAVWENWKKTEDNKMDGDQYMFLLSRNGNIAQSWHYHFIKDTDDHVLVHQSLTLSPEEANAKWAEMRQTWYKKLQTIEAETKK